MGKTLTLAILKYVALFALLLASMWLACALDWEPAVTFFGTLGAFLAADFASARRKEPTVPQVGIKWSPSGPSLPDIFRNANNSVLILGTSNFRLIHDELSEVRKWLEAKEHRIFGLLFLAPFSPHASGRARREVRRSSRESIISSLQTAEAEAERHARMIPAVYDGPYRYSAYAVDVGNVGDQYESKCSSINIFTSSHQRGLAKGFHISLLAGKSQDEYSFYKEEILELWRSTLANPPGHGVSCTFRRGLNLSDATVRQYHSLLRSGDNSELGALHIFSDQQLHLTLTSICRTQRSSFLGPLCIQNGQEPLPAHFGEFLHEVIAAASDHVNSRARIELTQLYIDEHGVIQLRGNRDQGSTPFEVLDSFLRYVSTLVDEFADRYPNEHWHEQAVGRGERRFGPKYNLFSPHVSIGVAFSSSTALPARLTGHSISVRLPCPLTFNAEELTIVHYAYRSLLRLVGELRVPAEPGMVPDGERVLAQLGIARP